MIYYVVLNSNTYSGAQNLMSGTLTLKNKITSMEDIEMMRKEVYNSLDDSVKIKAPYNTTYIAFFKEL